MGMMTNLQNTEDLVLEIERRFIADNPRSCEQVQRASHYLPGGSTRSALHFDPFPLVMEKASGSRITDLDGHVYIDVMNDLTAGLYGHSDPTISAALHDVIRNGMSLGALNLHEQRLAKEICQRFRSVERVRFCNSGTEANLIAMQLARVFTDRPKILAFKGGYHGSLLSYLSPHRSLNLGMQETRLANYNSISSVDEEVSQIGDDLAAISVEPMIGSGGGILAERDFLMHLREVCDATGALLIFDEVQTARVSGGGLQEVFDIDADLTTLGKFIGGGASFGAFGGKAAILDELDSSRPTALGHGGTFNNNVLSMAGGFAGYHDVATPQALHCLNEFGDSVREDLRQVAATIDLPLQLGGYGSIISIHFQHKKIERPGDVTTSAVVRKIVHLELIRLGIYTSRRGTINLSLANTRDDLDRFIAAFSAVCEKYREQIVDNGKA